MLQTWIARLIVVAAAFIVAYISWIFVAEHFKIRNLPGNIAGIILFCLITSTIGLSIYRIRRPWIRAALLGCSVALLVFIGLAFTRFWEASLLLHVPCPELPFTIIDECGAMVRPPSSLGYSILFGIPAIAGIISASFVYRTNRKNDDPLALNFPNRPRAL